MKLTGAEIIVRTLIEQGVTDVFGYPCGQIINVYDALGMWHHPRGYVSNFLMRPASS